MSTFASVFSFNSRKQERVALKKDSDPPVIYYQMKTRYYKWSDEDRNWCFVSKKKPPRFSKETDSLVFYFVDKNQSIEQCGVVIEFAQSIGPFDDEVAAELRLGAPVRAGFDAPGDPLNGMDAFKLPTVSDVVDSMEGYRFESKGKFDFAVTMITFPDRNKFWHDPEMDVDP